MATSLALFSGLRRSSMVPGGSLAKAASVGAKTVNGPAPLSVSTSPAALIAATSVLKLPAATAVSTISAFAPPSASTGFLKPVQAMRHKNDNDKAAREKIDF